MISSVVFDSIITFICASIFSKANRFTLFIYLELLPHNKIDFKKAIRLQQPLFCSNVRGQQQIPQQDPTRDQFLTGNCKHSFNPKSEQTGFCHEKFHSTWMNEKRLGLVK